MHKFLFNHGFNDSNPRARYDGFTSRKNEKNVREEKRMKKSNHSDTDFAPADEPVPFEDAILTDDPGLFDHFDDFDDIEDDYVDYIKENTNRKIRDWLDQTSFREFRNAICKEVRGQEEVEDILLCIYNYLECIANDRRHNNHALVAAPSGCGKSATFHAVRRYFAKEIPTLIVHRSDVSNITETGYRGLDPAAIIEPLFNADEKDGVGIIFMDEFDKKMVPSLDSHGVDNNLAVQNQILTMVEGCDVYGTGKGSPNNGCVNTEKTLFIGMGSFDSIRKARKEKSSKEKKTIGFGTAEKGKYCHFEPITREDILSLGSTNELMGRFPVLVNFHPLEEKVVNQIIDIQRKRVEENFGLEIVISKELRQALAEEANGPFGCREFYNVIFSTAIKARKHLMLAGKKAGDYKVILKPDMKYSVRKIRKKEDASFETENENS